MSDVLSLRLPPHLRASLKRHAADAGMSPHAFAVVTLTARLLRLDSAVEGETTAIATTAARVAALLDEAVRALAVGAPVMSLPSRQFADDMLAVKDALEAPHCAER